jgi:hypothetical protein
MLEIQKASATNNSGPQKPTTSLVQMKAVVETEKYGDLIGNSRFRDRIMFLLDNPDLAWRNLQKDEKPCCFGTIAYLLDANRKIRELWKKSGHNLDDYSDALGNYVVLPEDDRPGYVGMEPMELFLSTLQETAMEKDCVVALFWQNSNTEGFTGFGLGHSAVYLGKHMEKDMVFEQLGRGKEFRIRPMEDFVNLLSQEPRSTLKIKCYRLPEEPLAEKPMQVALETDTVLEWPNEDLVAEDIGHVLLEAHWKSLDDSAVVQYLKNQRVENFDPDNPEWESVPKTATVGELKRWFRIADECDFDPEEFASRRPRSRFDQGED